VIPDLSQIPEWKADDTATNKPESHSQLHTVPYETNDFKKTVNTFVI